MVGQIGLEPMIVKLADLQSAALTARRLAQIEECTELEIDGGPGWTRTNDSKTDGFTVRCPSR